MSIDKHVSPGKQNSIVSAFTMTIAKDSQTNGDEVNKSTAITSSCRNFIKLHASLLNSWNFPKNEKEV